MMMVVDMVTFLDALATVDVPVPASNNDVDLVETRTVHFAKPKSSSRFEREQTNSIAGLLPDPEISRDIVLIPSILKRV